MKSKILIISMALVSLFLVNINFVSAEFSNALDENMWETNGPVNTSVVSADGSKVYIGGKFDYVGPNTGSGVPVNLSTGESLPNFPKVSGIRIPPISSGGSGSSYDGGSVLASISDGNGGWYIGGAFNKVGESKVNGLAHVLPDYSVDSNFNNNVSAYIPGLYLCMSNPDYCSVVSSLALSPDGETLYVGGSFTSIGDKNRNNIAAINTATGKVKNIWNPNANFSVNDIVVSPDGNTVYVGGLFTFIGDESRYGIAALNALTGKATNFDPISSGQSNIQTLALSPDGEKLYAGGGFWNVGWSSSFAAIKTSTGAFDFSWILEAHGIYSLALSPDGNTIYIGGAFEELYNLDIVSQVTKNWETRNGLASVSAITGKVTDWNPDIKKENYQSYSGITVQSLVLSPDGNTIYIGGSFSSVGGQDRSNVAATSTSTGQATTFKINTGQDVTTLALDSNNTLYIGGSFTSIGGKMRNYIAALSTSTGQATDWDPNIRSVPGGVVDLNPIDVSVDTIILNSNNSTLYVGGLFDHIGDKFIDNIAAIYTSTGKATNWNPNSEFSNLNQSYPSSGRVSALALSPDNNTVYAGGRFQRIGGKDKYYLAALYASTGQATALNFGLCGYPKSLALSPDGEKLFFGGDAPYPACVMNGLSVATAKGIMQTPYVSVGTATGHVYALAPSLDGKVVYTGGFFYSIGGQDKNSLAALSTSTGVATVDGLATDWEVDWEPTSWGPNSVRDIMTFSLSPDGNTLYAGGQTNNTDKANYISAISTCDGKAIAFSPNVDDNVVSISTSPDGKTVYAGGMFKAVGGNSRSYFAKFNVSDANFSCPTPTPIPTPCTPITWSPDPATVCSGTSFTQTSNCDTTRTADGTKICSTPTPTPTPTTSPSPTPASCLGISPTNSTPCPGDDTGLIYSLSKRTVSNCTTARKCEYRCNAGYRPDNSLTKCIQSCTGEGC